MASFLFRPEEVEARGDSVVEVREAVVEGAVSEVDVVRDVVVEGDVVVGEASVDTVAGPEAADLPQKQPQLKRGKQSDWRQSRPSSQQNPLVL